VSVNKLILHELVRGIWHISPEHARIYFPIIEAMLLRQSVDQETHQSIEKNYPQQSIKSESVHAAIVKPNGVGQYFFPQEDFVGIIPINGAITKYSSSFGYGTQDYEAWIRMAAGTRNCKSIMLMLDTPGGSVYGTLSLRELISKVEKPVVAFIDSMCCSAGVELAVPADVIIASNDMDYVGSIGTMMSWWDMKKELEKDGAKYHELYATLSTEKNKMWRDAEAGQSKDLITKMLDPLNEDFIAWVKSNRAGRLNEKTEGLFNGRTWFAKEALSFGLIDEIMNFDSAIGFAFELSKTQNRKTISLR